jgi:hypothetical protein
MLSVATPEVEAERKFGFGDLLARTRSTSLVFRYPAAVEPPVPSPCEGRDEWVFATESTISLLFAREPDRRDILLQFLKAGCAGLLLVRDGQWLCHGWYSLPGSALPCHLPLSCRRRGGYWVFFCRVREGFRGQGFYKALLVKTVSSIRAADPLASIEIDTEPDNLASRHAIQASGFLRIGMIVSYKFGIPSRWRRIVGRWDPALQHPPYAALSQAAPRAEEAS